MGAIKSESLGDFVGIRSNLFACKEIVFSVDHKRKIKGAISLHQRFYVTTICENSGRWHWAEAEPATSRWGALQ